MRRIGLRVFFASVALNAALAIVALLAGSFGELEGKILFSSLCVTGSLVLVLACEAARERGALGLLPRAGAAASLAGFALVIAGIWTESEDSSLTRIMTTLLAAAVAAALISLLSLAELPPRFRWTFLAAAALAALLAALLVSGIWGEWENDWFWRWLGAVAVALAAFVIVVPVLGRVGRREAGAIAARVSFCPLCASPVSARAGAEVRCDACGGVFAVTVRKDGATSSR